MSSVEPVDIEPWTDGLDVFRAAGIRVVPIEDFDLGATWVPQAKVMLIATDLSLERRRQIAEKYVSIILERRASETDR